MYDADYRESLVHSILQIVENTESVHEEIREAVTERIRTDHGPAAEDYWRAINHDGEHQIARDIMDVVRDTIYDHALAGLPASLGRTLLSDLLDYGNVAVWEKAAASYVPTVADYARATDDPEADLY